MKIKTIANLGRFKDIIFILIKYGFGGIVERLELPSIIVKNGDRVDKRMSVYERFRMALEDLGPTFIKFGQIMSLRSDLLPKPLVLELRKLQDDVAPVEFARIRKVAEDSFERPLEDIFILIEEEAVAAASLSQVHRAVLKDTRQPVAVKIQRPDIRKTIETDLDILGAIAEQIDERLSEYEIYDLPGLVHLTRRNIERELNFNREAGYMKIARANRSDTPGVHIPEPINKYCTESVLVMELIEGKKITQLAPGTIQDPEELAKRGLRLTIKQILEDGFFHADPHPGNILIDDRQNMCLLDWGMVGRLTEEERYDLIDFLYAIVENDSSRLVESLLVITAAEGEVNRRRLERQLLDILDAYMAVPLKDLNLGAMILDITELLRENRLRLPPDLFIMLKALITVEGTARQIYPELDVISEAAPYLRDVAAERLSPGKLFKRFKSTIYRLLTYRGKLNRRFVGIVDKIDRGELTLRFEHKKLGGLQNTLENIFSRLTFGIIIAAMIIGSSMIITTGVEPFLFGFPAIGIIGYIISAVVGIWLIINIIKTRRY